MPSARCRFARCTMSWVKCCFISRAGLGNGIPNAAACFGNFKIGFTCNAHGVIFSPVTRKTNVRMAIYKAGQQYLLALVFLLFGLMGWLFLIRQNHQQLISVHPLPAHHRLAIMCNCSSSRRLLVAALLREYLCERTY
jgi:hypothetical protein